MKIKFNDLFYVEIGTFGLCLSESRGGNSYQLEAWLLELLSQAHSWIELDDWLALAGVNTATVTSHLSKLLEWQVLLVEGTLETHKALEIYNNWFWGKHTENLHYSVRHTQWKDAEEVISELVERETQDPGPILFSEHEQSEIILADFPATISGVNLAKTVYKRRSQREFSGDSLHMDQLADCLFCGKGIVKTEWTEYGHLLPYATTPSGGGRNPYDLYVMVRNVEGLKAGIYRYNGFRHSLIYVDQAVESFTEVMAKQDWCEEAAAIIVSVATFERTSWKYRHPTAYRVVLIESGFIFQNILLAATACNVASTPFGAMDFLQVEKLLKLDTNKQAALFCCALGQASTEVPQSRLGKKPRMANLY